MHTALKQQSGLAGPQGVRVAKLLAESAIIFFGTLIAAGLLALGEPVAWERPVTKDFRQAADQLIQFARHRARVIPAIDYGPTPVTEWHE